MRRDEIEAVYELGVDSVDELVARLFSIIETQQAEIESLKSQVKELQERLSTNSRNSSKPPSADGFNKQTRSLRKKSGKKTGGQAGHQGHRLALREQPDATHLHPPQSCTSCGVCLAEVEGKVSSERRQVFDLPPLKLEVREHRVSRKRCHLCGTEQVGEFPLEVPPGASYGARIKAFLVYLHKGQLIPVGRSCQVVTDLFTHSPSEGSLHTIIRECSAELEEVCELIKETAIKAAVANFDETGIAVEQKLGWLHTASTKEVTYYAFDAQRGRAAMDRIGILAHFHGVACHDALASYLSYRCRHSLCNAHSLRELTFLEEVQERVWAGEMKTLLVYIKSRVDKAVAAGTTELREKEQAKFVKKFEEILQRGFAREAQEPALPTGRRGRHKQSKGKNLLDRLCKYQEETLRFMRDFRVPFDNNLAERDLRMMKVQQKISGCFRTKEGARDFCRIRSYLSTMRKQGHNLLETLRTVFEGNPLLPDTG